MRKMILFAVLLTVIMMVGNIGSAAAQSDPVKNYTFESEAIWLDEPYTATVSATVGIRIRAIPTEIDNEPRISVPVNTVVDVVAQVTNNDGDEWVLVSAWVDGEYQDSGWMQIRAAQLNRNNPPDVPEIQECTLTDEGEQIFVGIRFNEGWADYALSDDCTRFYEGRTEITDFHHYWVTRESTPDATDTVLNTTILHNGFIWLLEGTGWNHPTTWSMARGFKEGDTGQSLEFPPMISYFAADKQQVMAREGYAYDFVVHTASGQEFTYPYGAFGTTVNNVDRCDLDAPRPMNITGIAVPNTDIYRSTSVGAEGCRSLFFWQLEDETYTVFVLSDTDENLVYRFSFLAVLIPSDWGSSEIREYIIDTVKPIANNETPTNTTVIVTGVNGMTEFVTQ